MDKHSSTESDFSTDSLNEEFKRKISMKDAKSDANVDTILVPFYDKDVLIKVSKHQKNMKKHDDGNKYINHIEKQKQDRSQKNFLVNKGSKNSKCKSYLEMFRKQFSPNYNDSKVINDEIRSLSPEVGDTEVESISEFPNDIVGEFFNTEAYNEMYYEKLINNDHELHFDNSLEELRFTDDIRSKSPNEAVDNNLRSISEVSQPRRRLRRVTAEPIQNIKLGGLGPDVEKIKPCLERARSLQRYSEKVRRENRVRIYKKSINADNKNEKEANPRYSEQRYPAKDKAQDKRNLENGQSPTFLMNKNIQDKTPKVTGNVHFSKSKSADVKSIKERALKRVQNLRSAPKKRDSFIPKKDFQDSVHLEKKTEQAEENVKLSAKIRDGSKNKDISIPPVHISFMVNVGGTRPSSALKTLEEKHRMYQEQIRSFNMEHNI